MKKVLGLAILASLVAAPALAGETYVRNEWTKSNSHTNTDLKLDSKTTSNRTEKYDAVADKIYVDGSAEYGKGEYGSKSLSYDDFSIHTASSGLWGKFNEDVVTKVSGTIKTRSNSSSKSHETSAGVR